MTSRLLDYARRNWLWLVLGALAVGHVVLFMQLFVKLSYDVELYYDYASKMVSGLLPYRDFAVEYPPGALLVFLLPRLFVSSPEAYNTAFTVEMMLCDLACLFIMPFLARRLKLSPLSTLAIYTLAVISVGSIGIQRYDFAAAAVTLAALFAFSRGNYKTAWVLLAVGTLVKLYPIALAPFFFLYQIRHQRWQSLVMPLLLSGALGVACCLPFWLASPDGFIHAFALQGGRNLQIESSYASVLFMLYGLGRVQLSVFQGPVSWDMDSAYSSGIAQIAIVIMAIAAAAVYISYYLPRKRKNVLVNAPPSAEAMGRIINFSLLVIIMLLLASKVVSTQFMVWLVPLVPLVSGRARHAVWPVFMAVGWLTWYIYPVHYWDLRYLYATPISAIFVRNVLLGLMAFWLWELKLRPTPAVAPSLEGDWLAKPAPSSETK